MGEGITEFELIDLLRSRSGGSARLKTGIGDDAAITDPGGSTATSVDAIVEGVHFRRDWFPPEAIAHKAVASALSDLAAMAAEPGEIYVTLGVPPETDRETLTGLAEGFGSRAEAFGVVLAGGDTVASPVLFVAVTVVGHRESAKSFVTRSGAAPGDLVAVTSELGGAAAGLWLLENGTGSVAGIAPEVAEALVERQLRPSPRLEAGLVLSRHGATAMVDISDGLLQDLGHIAMASGVSITVDRRQVPEQPGVAAVEAASRSEADGLSLAGGEDYELAVTLPEPAFEAARREIETLGYGLAAIGRVAGGAGVALLGEDSARPPPAGFDHLA